MSDTETEEKFEIIVTLFGQPLTLVLPAKWNFTEGKIAKDNHGLLPVQVEAGIFSGDPDAYMAVLEVSYRRAGRDFPAEAIGEMNIFELVDAITEKVNALRPPTEPSGSDSSPSEPSSSESIEEPVSA